MIRCSQHPLNLVVRKNIGSKIAVFFRERFRRDLICCIASDVSPFAFWYADDPAGGCIRFPTETECERLMGLPEGWTKYGVNGEEILSSHRYRALGNAIALPCAEYIMRGIYDVLTRRC